MKPIRACALSLLISCSCAWATEPEGRAWADLFNGADLSGWVSGGEPDAWGVTDGEIVTVKPGSGGWLRTDRMYRDFELELDFWMPEGGNSGLGLRGSSGGDPAFTGFEVQMLDSHGQEPGLRNCGAVYEAIAPATMAVKPAGEWNTLRVRLVGDTLDVWLNGEHVQQGQTLDARGFFRNEGQPLPLDTRATTGYIALQDHGHPFRYRNLRIKDLSPDPEPVGMQMLIDPSLSGWFSRDLGTWSYDAAEGALKGENGPGHFFTHAEWTDFELRGLVKINERGNSGLYFRTQPNPAMPWPIGYEAQVDQHDPKNYTGCVYNMCAPESGPGAEGPITRDGAWFDYRIIAQGDRIRTWVNGVPMVDCERDDFSKGRFAVQGHHPGSVVMCKDLRVLDLAREED